MLADPATSKDEHPQVSFGLVLGLLWWKNRADRTQKLLYGCFST